MHKGDNDTFFARKKYKIAKLSIPKFTIVKSTQDQSAEDPTSIQLIKLKLHSVYLISGLLIAIILLATGQWTPQQKFTEYLSNAATLVSVVLALVAIFYSFVSNDSLSKSLGSISNVSEQIGQTREQMAIYVDRSSDIARDASDGASRMLAASSEMKTSFAELNLLLSTMHGQTTTFKEVLDQVPSRFDKLEAFIQESKTPLDSAATFVTVSDLLPDTYVEAFINRASVVANLLSYAVVLAASSQRDLVLAAYCDAIDLKQSNQFAGIIRTMNAIGLIQTREKEVFKFTVVSVHPTLAAQAELYLKDYIAQGLAADRQEIWKARVTATEAYFTVQ